MNINPVQLHEMYEKYPNINRVSIFQCNKEEKFYGQNTYGHDVDTIVKVSGGCRVKCDARLLNKKHILMWFHNITYEVFIIVTPIPHYIVILLFILIFKYRFASKIPI